MKADFFLQILGILLLAFGFLLKHRKTRISFVFLGISLTSIAFVINNNYLALIFTLLIATFFACSYFKRYKTYNTVNILEVDIDDSYVKEFSKYYAKSLYQYFPIYTPNKSYSVNLLIRDMNVAGLLIFNKVNDIAYIEVDFIKPEYRDFYIGNYIYKQNTGYFKKNGINKLMAKSYHYLHSKYLLKMGFKQTLVDGELFFVKNID